MNKIYLSCLKFTPCIVCGAFLFVCGAAVDISLFKAHKSFALPRDYDAAAHHRGTTCPTGGMTMCAWCTTGRRVPLVFILN